MRQFTNISMESLAKLLGIRLNGRKAVIGKNTDDNVPHFLTAQVKLFLLLNFHANSNTGATSLLSCKEMAAKLHCHIKTVYSSLDMLAKHDFINFADSAEPGYIEATVLHLSDMYKRRGEDGKGYITFNTDLLETILSAKDINVLRVLLTSLIETVTRNTLSASKALKETQISFKMLSSAFPSSTRPRDIRTACDEKGLFGDLFARTSSDLRKTIFVKLKDDYDGKYIKQKIRVEAKKSIITEIESINEAIRKSNTGIFEDGIIHISDALSLRDHDIDLLNTIDVVHPDHDLPLLDLNSDIKNDCATIAQDYGIDTVITAIRTFYSNYLLPGNFKADKSKSLGGLLRRIVEEIIGQPGLLTA